MCLPGKKNVIVDALSCLEKTLDEEPILQVPDHIQRLGCRTATACNVLHLASVVLPRRSSSAT